MDRACRPSLALVAILVVTIAGCGSAPIVSDAPGPTDSTGTTGETETTQDPLTTEPGPETPTAGGTDPPTESGPHTVPPDERLVLRKSVEANVTVSSFGEGGTPPPTDTSSDALREEAAASVTYGPGERGEFAVTEIEVDGYVVLSLDGEVIWQGTVEPYEHVTLRVDRDGDVEVVDYFVL